MPDNDQDVSVNIVGSTEGLEEAGNAFAQLTRSLDSGANSAEALASRLEGTNKRIKQTMADTAAAVAIPDRPEPVIRDYKDTLKNKPVKTPEEKKELEKRNRQLEEASRKHMAEWNAKEEQREKDAAKAKQARAKKSNDEAMAQAKRNREAAAAAQQADSVAQVKKALGVADTETGNTGDPKGASSLLFWARRSGMLTGEFGKLASAGGRLNTLFGTLSGTAMRTAVGIAAGVGVLVAAVWAAKKAVEIMGEAITKASALELKLIPLGNMLGQGPGGGARRWEEIKKASHGTGTSPDEVLKAMPALEVETQGQLSSGAGLKALIDMASRTGNSFEAVSAAVAKAHETLRTSQDVQSAAKDLNRLGLISDALVIKMEKMRGLASPAQQWEILAAAMQKTVTEGQNANETFGGLMKRLHEGVSSTWDRMMEALGESFVKAMGPALEGFLSSLEELGPHLEDLAHVIGQVLGGIASACAEIATFIATWDRIFESTSEDAGLLLYNSLMWAFMASTRAFLDILTVGILEVAGIPLFKTEMEETEKRIRELMEANKGPDKGRKPDATRLPGLDNVIGAWGPKAVVDSLQAVGGGGNASGVTWQSNMLDVAKDSRKSLYDIARAVLARGGSFEEIRTKVLPTGYDQFFRGVSGETGISGSSVMPSVVTPNVNRSMSGGGAGDTSITLLSSIRGILQSMLGKMSSGGGMQGALVTRN